MTLEGAVAAIISVREVAINIGADHGVREGMVFAILAESPIVVRDPSGGEVLGNVDREKVRVKATQVSPKFSVCETFERYWTGGADWGGLLGTTRGLFAGEWRDRTLMVEDSQLPQPLPEDQSYVKVGDRVRQVGVAEEAGR